MTKREWAGCAAAAAALLLFEILGRVMRIEDLWFPMAETVLTRLIGAVFFFFLLRRMGTSVFARPSGGAWVTALAMLVALNNLPLRGLLTGRAWVTASPGMVLLFAAECAAVGLFEELAFRGFLFPYCVGRFAGRSRPVFWGALVSSAVFGLIHAVNLFSGASPGAVLMQIGYSFLIGGMCAAVYTATGSLWVGVLVHAVYNFCGTLVPRLGEGDGWDPLTVAVTAVLGTAAAMLLTRFLWKAENTPGIEKN